MVASVRGAVGTSKLGDVVWERAASEVIVVPSGAATTRIVKPQLTVRELLQVAQSAWMRCSVIASVLVKLAEHETVLDDSSHIMLCEKFTTMTRTPQNKSVQVGAARAIAKRWAVAAGSSRSVVTLVNHNNVHWCAARIDLIARNID